MATERITYVTNRKVLYQEFDGEGVLFEETTDTVHQLNQTAFFIWKMCETEVTDEQILAGFVQHFDAPAEEVAPEIAQTLDEMAEKNLLIRNAPRL